MDADEIARLREINEKATPGPWVDSEPRELGYSPSNIQTQDGASVLAMMYGGGPKVAIDKAQERRNAAYIAAFDPTTTRALLDAAAALEQARRERDDLQGLKVTDEICFDRVVAQRDAAQQDAKEARALLKGATEATEDFSHWNSIAVFRARIEAMLEKKL